MSEKRFRLEPKTYNLTRNYKKGKNAPVTYQRKKRIAPQGNK